MKTRRMSKRFKTNALCGDSKYQYIISGLKSNTFKKIERQWKVYLPFNMEDLDDYN